MSLKQFVVRSHRSLWRTPRILRFTALGCGFVLVLAVWPGLPGKVLLGIPAIFATLLGMAVWFLWIAIRTRKDVTDWWRRDLKLSRHGGLVSVLVVSLTFGLLKLHVPQRIGLATSIDKFSRALDCPSFSAKLNGGQTQRFGIYLVDDIRLANGTVHFQTCSDSFTFRITTCGFAYLPGGFIPGQQNPQRRYGHLFGQWYVYQIDADL